MVQLTIDIPNFVFYFVDKLVVYCLTTYFFYTLKFIDNNNEITIINELGAEIRKINKAQDYIHDLIDTN